MVLPLVFLPIIHIELLEALALIRHELKGLDDVTDVFLAQIVQKVYFAAPEIRALDVGASFLQFSIHLESLPEFPMREGVDYVYYDAKKFQKKNLDELIVQQVIFLHIEQQRGIPLLAFVLIDYESLQRSKRIEHPLPELHFLVLHVRVYHLIHLNHHGRLH